MDHIVPCPEETINDEMSHACAVRAMTFLVERWLAKRGLTADVSVRGPLPLEEVEQLRQEQIQKLIKKEVTDQ